MRDDIIMAVKITRERDVEEGQKNIVYDRSIVQWQSDYKGS